MALMSLREYAKRRGCALRAVQVAIESGRLQKSLGTELFRGSPTTRIADPDLADREWEANTNPSYQHSTKNPYKPATVAASPQPPAAQQPKPPADEDESDENSIDRWLRPDGMPDLEAAMRANATKPQLDRLKICVAIRRDITAHDVETKTLIDANEAATEILNAVATAKNSMLGLKSRIKQRLPHISLADLDAIDKMVREVLTELSTHDQH